MKEPRKFLESSRPINNIQHTINFCLERLFQDKEHSINDQVVKDLFFEEIIGALLQARDYVESFEKDDE